MDSPQKIKSIDVTRTQVCVNDIQQGEPSGVLYNPYFPEQKAFFGYLAMIDILDGFFNEIRVPHAFNQYRTFAAKEEALKPAKEVTRYMEEDIFTTKLGDKVTFTIQVQYRQNATWQGTIAWIEGKKVQRFRSTLEMIKLMDSALAMANGSEEDIAWD